MGIFLSKDTRVSQLLNLSRGYKKWMSTSDGKKMSEVEPFLSRYVVVAALYIWNGVIFECHY